MMAGFNTLSVSPPHQVSTGDRIPGNKIHSAERFTLQREKKKSEDISSPNKRSEIQLTKTLPISSLEHTRWMADGGWPPPNL